MAEKYLESKIESRLKSRVKAVGGLCYKFKSTVAGVPDQIIIHGGSTYFVEVKRPGETPRANQIHVHREIEKRGVPVYVVDTYDAIDDFITTILGAEIPAPDTAPKPVTVQSKDAFKLI